MLVLDIIFGRGLETAGSSCFPHGNTLQAVKSRWKRSAWREWSALHAANPRICGCELLTLGYELFALNRHPPTLEKLSWQGQAMLIVSWTCLGNVSGQSAGSPSGDSSFPLPCENQRALWSLLLQQDTADVSGTSFSHHLWQDHHLSTQGEEWLLCPHSLHSSVTPWKLTPGDAAVQSAPSWAAGLEPRSNLIKGALGQKEIVVEFRKGLSTLRHSVHGFGRALCISSNA